MTTGILHQYRVQPVSRIVTNGILHRYLEYPGRSGDTRRGLVWGFRAFSEGTLGTQDWGPCWHTNKGTNTRNTRRMLGKDYFIVVKHVIVATPWWTNGGVEPASWGISDDHKLCPPKYNPLSSSPFSAICLSGTWCVPIFELDSPAGVCVCECVNKIKYILSQIQLSSPILV